MVDLNALNNNVSNATAGPSTQKVISGSLFNGPVPISSIKANLDELQTYFNVSFPNDPSLSSGGTPGSSGYYTTIGISNYSRVDFNTIGRLNPYQTIRLPLPLQLVDAHGVQFEDSAIGAVQGNAYSAARSKNNATAAGTVAEATLGGIAGAIGQSGNGFLAYSGYSPNQFVTILLKGPQYKRYSLNWKLAPRNAEESRTLKTIIRMLNNAMAPQLSIGGAWFKFPKIMQVSFFPSSQYLFKCKPAVLENISINYAAGGVPAFYRASSASEGQNAPESYEIQMNFLEIEFWLQGDYTDNNNPLDTNARNLVDPVGINAELGVFGKVIADTFKEFTTSIPSIPSITPFNPNDIAQP